MDVAAKNSTPAASWRLRSLRHQLGLTMREVEETSAQVAGRHSNRQFLVPPARLSDIETLGILPTIYRFYSLAVAYHRDIHDLMSWFGVDLNLIASDIPLSTPPNSHLCDAFTGTSSVKVPTGMNHNFDGRNTTYFNDIVQQWGHVPITLLSHLANGKYTYGYLGGSDLMMYPLIPPGSFIQIDESRNRVLKGHWKSEYERPIYLVETRAGKTCCWCTLNNGEIILQPHPLSPCPAMALRHPQDAEVIGQVVGVAMKLSDRNPHGQSETPM